MLWICVHLSGLVCSHSVFETCWNICYRYVNNAAIYSLFSGKRGRSWPWPPGEAVCLRGNCICFGFLLKKVQAPPLLKVRWCLWAVPWPGWSLSRAAGAQVSPKPGSWGSSRLSRAKSLKPSLVTNLKTNTVKTCHASTWHPYSCNLLGNGFSSPWSPYVWSAEHRQVAGALERALLCLSRVTSLCSYLVTAG